MNLTLFGELFCPDSVNGAGLSHIQIYEDVINKNYKNVLIFEDDVNNFHEDLNNALLELPKNYDIFYIGIEGLYDNKNPYDPFFFILNKKYISIPPHPLGLHAYFISNKICA